MKLSDNKVKKEEKKMNEIEKRFMKKVEEAKKVAQQIKDGTFKIDMKKIAEEYRQRVVVKKIY